MDVRDKIAKIILKEVLTNKNDDGMGHWIAADDILDVLPNMEWQPIETAPKNGTSILGWNGRIVSEMIWDEQPDDDGHIGWCSAGFSYGGVLYELHYTPLGEPTHWMPLPDPPSKV